MLRKIRRFPMLLSALVVAAMSAVPALATESGTVTAETVLSGLTTGLTTTQGHMFTGINNALPLALSVAGVILAVTIGYRIFKRMSKG